MDDWVSFVSSTGGESEVTLERDAEALIERLEAFGSRVGSLTSPARAPSPEASEPSQHSVSPQSTASERRESLEESSCLSVCSEERSARAVDGHRAAERLYANARQRHQAAVEKENSTLEMAEPQINARSRALKRDGPIGARLHQEAQAKAARQQEALEHEVKRREEEERAAEVRQPAINELSVQLMRDRSGDVADRLYSQARRAAGRQEQRELDQQQQLKETARPEISTGSQRIAAVLPGRHAPVQERLYAEASARKAYLTSAAHAPTGDSFRPTISAVSRKLAERAHGGASFEERLGQRTSPRDAPPSSELLECVHTPAVNAKSEQLVQKRMRREGGNLSVEERLLAVANKPPPTVEEPEHRPAINPNSERILQRRGNVAPLEQRLQQGVRNTRPGIAGELEQCSYAPAISSGSQRLLAKKERVPVTARLMDWGQKHARGEGDATLEDRRFKFGPDKSGDESPRASVVPKPRARKPPTAPTAPVEAPMAKEVPTGTHRYSRASTARRPAAPSHRPARSSDNDRTDPNTNRDRRESGAGHHEEEGAWCNDYEDHFEDSVDRRGEEAHPRDDGLWPDQHLDPDDSVSAPHGYGHGAHILPLCASASLVLMGRWWIGDTVSIRDWECWGGAAHSLTQSHTVSVTPSLTQSHTVTPSLTQSHTVTPNLTQSHTVSHSHTQSHTVSPSLTQSHTVSHSHTQSHTVSPSHTQSHTVSHSHTQSHTV